MPLPVSDQLVLEPFASAALHASEACRAAVGLVERLMLSWSDSDSEGYLEAMSAAELAKQAAQLKVMETRDAWVEAYMRLNGGTRDAARDVFSGTVYDLGSLPGWFRG